MNKFAMTLLLGAVLCYLCGYHETIFMVIVLQVLSGVVSIIKDYRSR